jgi:hypothetical protein
MEQSVIESAIPNNVEGSTHGLILSIIFMSDRGKPHNTSVRIVSVPAEIQTRYLTDTSYSLKL